jgi:predicted dehydrogenase
MRDLDRRSFLAGSTALLGAASKLPAANDRIQLGFVGVGGRGQWLARAFSGIGEKHGLCRIAAVCDVWEKRRREASERYQCPGYTDYRELVDRPDIDAVVVATPDHWHAPVSLYAMEKGKDVYVEKPMCHTLGEARSMIDACHRQHRVLQVGSHGASSSAFLKIKELLAQGIIGRTIMIHGSAHRNSTRGEWNWKIYPEAGPDGKGDNHIDWKQFLGSAPDRPWDPDRYFNFRKFWDYSGGVATDLYYHMMAPLNMAWGEPHLPSTVTASGGIYQFPDREVPDTYHMIAEYPQGFSVILTSSMANGYPSPLTIRGHLGTIIAGPQDGALSVRPENGVITEQYKSRFGDSEISVPLEPSSDWAHQLNFLECVRTRAKTNADVVTGAYAQVAITMGVMAYRQKRMLQFHPDDWSVS